MTILPSSDQIDEDIDERSVTKQSWTIHGMIFVGNQGLGFASYHFNPPSNGGCFVSYKKARFFKFDNGDPFPVRQPFIDCEYNEEERKFTGFINLEPNKFKGN